MLPSAEIREALRDVLSNESYRNAAHRVAALITELGRGQRAIVEVGSADLGTVQGSGHLARRWDHRLSMARVIGVGKGRDSASHECAWKRLEWFVRDGSFMSGKTCERRRRTSSKFRKDFGGASIQQALLALVVPTACPL